MPPKNVFLIVNKMDHLKADDFDCQTGLRRSLIPSGGSVERPCVLWPVISCLLCFLHNSSVGIHCVERWEKTTTYIYMTIRPTIENQSWMVSWVESRAYCDPALESSWSPLCFCVQAEQRLERQRRGRPLISCLICPLIDRVLFWLINSNAIYWFGKRIFSEQMLIALLYSWNRRHLPHMSDMCKDSFVANSSCVSPDHDYVSYSQ